MLNNWVVFTFTCTNLLKIRLPNLGFKIVLCVCLRVRRYQSQQPMSGHWNINMYAQVSQAYIFILKKREGVSKIEHHNLAWGVGLSCKLTRFSNKRVVSGSCCYRYEIITRSICHFIFVVSFTSTVISEEIKKCQTMGVNKYFNNVYFLLVIAW